MPDALTNQLPADGPTPDILAEIDKVLHGSYVSARLPVFISDIRFPAGFTKATSGPYDFVLAKPETWTTLLGAAMDEAFTVKVGVGPAESSIDASALMRYSGVRICCISDLDYITRTHLVPVLMRLKKLDGSPLFA